MAALVAGAFLFSNREEVIEAIVPTPTPEPTRPASSYALSASLYNRDGEYEKAIESYRSAIQLAPENSEYYVKLIELFTLTGEAEDALFWAERAALLAPDDDSVLTAVASAYLINGDRLAEIGEREEAVLQYERAIETADRATQINPNNAAAYAYMAGAVVRQDRDQFLRAQELVEVAYGLDPNSAIVRYYRGVVLETQGYYQRAIDEYEAAVQLSPGYVDPALSLAYAYYYSDNRARAINVLRDLIEENPTDADSYDALGWFLFQAGQYPEAEDVLLEAVQLDPDMIRAHAHLGATLFRNSKYEQAVDELEIAVANYDEVLQTNAIFFNMLGFAYFRLDAANCDEAVPLFQRVVESPNVAVDTFNGQNAQIGLEDCRQATLSGE